ncbi:hypothetical protein [Rhodopseudomonas sp. B29]|uniref:hypothetical protein n=1 Tax=Rhodopseudomonas sp. B29 TaxID=95607 RepID=UPI0011D23961|nr:hypothetical protein [Rhodopseudomonas sp. B29]
MTAARAAHPSRPTALRFRVAHGGHLRMTLRMELCQKEAAAKTIAVMAGLVPAIHEYRISSKKDVDGRDEPGHDGVISVIDQLLR